MRMMMRISMPTEGANRVVKDGLFPQLVKDTTDLIKPEAMYFGPDHGRRTAFFFFDMTESAQMVEIAERWFTTTNATVELMPVMNLDDLRAGLQRMPKK